MDLTTACNTDAMAACNSVLVIGLNGIGLMPTTPRKARKLLKSGKADVARMNPFTIRLKYKTGSAAQVELLGIDTGEQHIGFAVVREDDAQANNQADGQMQNQAVVQYQADLELRKSMEKKKLLTKKNELRRGRRHRKVRYRHPKFRMARVRVYNTIPDKKGRHWHTVKRDINTGRQKGWLPPSIQSKVDHHINWIRKYQEALPLCTRTVIEVARFDIQKLMNPEIKGKQYQRGRMYGWENTKAYVLAKFNYTCPICGHKFDGTHRAKLHHTTYRSNGATDNPDEFAPICEQCHVPDEHKDGGELDKLRQACKRKEYREPTFMNILRKRLFKAFPDAEFTYGHVTNADRKILNLDKSHANDAVAIAVMGTGVKEVVGIGNVICFRQVRRKKRSLHEANPRKGTMKNGVYIPNRKAVRNAKNTKQNGKFHIYDTVLYGSRVGYISGFTGKYDAYVVNFEGEYIRPDGKDYKQISLSKLKLLDVRTNNYITRVM